MNLFFHLLILSLLSAGSARVVKNFEKSCGQFFAKGKSPTGFNEPQYQQICQNLNGIDYFATLYDVLNKIPVYSAYVFEGVMGCTRLDKWYIEPQLDDNNGGESMALSKSVEIGKRGVHQALNKDYKNSGFDKGHLAPVYHARSQKCAEATFTLTNAAPQVPYFNHGNWKTLEGHIAKELFQECTKNGYPAYVVTGVVPSKALLINKRVNVPIYFWTAFCCLNMHNKCVYSGGAIGINDNNGKIIPKAVVDLEKQLKDDYGKTFTLFQ